MMAIRQGSGCAREAGGLETFEDHISRMETDRCQSIIKPIHNTRSDPGGRNGWMGRCFPQFSYFPLFFLPFFFLIIIIISFSLPTTAIPSSHTVVIALREKCGGFSFFAFLLLLLVFCSFSSNMPATRRTQYLSQSIHVRLLLANGDGWFYVLRLEI